MIRRLIGAVPVVVWAAAALVLFAATAVQLAVDQHRAGVVIDELAADSRRQRAALASAGVDPNEVGPAPEDRLRALDGDPAVMADPPALSPAERDELADEAARRALARVVPPPAVSSSPPEVTGELPPGGADSGDRGPDEEDNSGAAPTVSPSPSPSPVTRCPAGTVRDRVTYADGRTGSGCVDLEQPSPSPSPSTSSPTPEATATSGKELQELAARPGPAGAVLVAAAGIAAATLRRRR